MHKLNLKSDKSYEWNSDKIKCPDKTLSGNNYNFYKALKIDGDEYVIGSGVLIKSDEKLYFACIHYFYDINYPVKNRYRVAVELFYKPNEIQAKLNDSRVEFDADYEVIKKESLVLSHFSLTSIIKRCLLVYGLTEEDPLELIQEFSEQTTDPIYICRFVSCFVDNTFVLRDAVNKTNDSSSETNDCSDSRIKINECGDSRTKTKDCSNSRTKTKHCSDSRSKTKHCSDSRTKTKDCSDSRTKTNDCSDSRTKTNDCNDSVFVISDSEDESRTPISNKYKNFSVTTCIEENSKILLKIKREPQTPAQNLEKSPSTLIKSLRISEPEEILPNFQHLILNSPDQMSPVVLLDRLNITNNQSQTPNVRKSRRISERRASQQLEMPQIETSTRSRRSTRISYAKFYQINETQSPPRNARKHPKINEENEAPVGTPTSTRKRRTSVVKIETTPKKVQKTQTQTPRSSKVWLKNMTPCLKDRDSPIVFGNTPMSRARLGLSAHNVPLKMPCREAEYLSIYNFVSVRIKDHTSGCMYISGVPGTGKTMTVCKVMNDMSEQKEDYGQFVFLKLNALALTEPRQIYVQIIKKLLNKKLHWEEALKEINRFFKAKKKQIPHVILIDELDKLCNRKQDVVYNLLDLPFNSVTPLIVITIANTMDLPERILSNKVNSRLGLVRQTFKPYQYKDLVKIVTERLAADAVFKNEALELVARKVAAVSGDARRALTMCSRATEIAEEENKDLVTMEIVDRVIKEMSSSSKVQAIQCCSKLEQFVLASIANEASRTGNEEVPFLNMLYNLEKLCVLESFKLPAIELILKSCHNLGSFRLLITQHGRTDLHMTLMLNISADDIHYALRNNT